MNLFTQMYLCLLANQSHMTREGREALIDDWRARDAQADSTIENATNNGEGDDQ